MTPVAEKAAPVPRAAVKVSEIVYRSTNEQEWSVATLLQGDRELVGVCWSNGGRFGRDFKDQEWFLLPDEVGKSVLETARQLKAKREEEILRGYQEMAADEEGEKEAMEWIESNAGECL